MGELGLAKLGGSQLLDPFPSHHRPGDENPTVRKRKEKKWKKNKRWKKWKKKEPHREQPLPWRYRILAGPVLYAWSDGIVTRWTYHVPVADMTILIFLSRFLSCIPFPPFFSLFARCRADCSLCVLCKQPNTEVHGWRVPCRTGKSVCYFGLLYHTGDGRRKGKG